MTLARTERAALADLLGTLGPDQPTLCDGWETGDLLAHLLVRERRLDAVLGIFIKPLAGWTARVSAGYRRRTWARQVELFRSGPPAYSPFSWGSLDAKANGMELFIHHEDVRRGQPDWQPRPLDEGTREEVIRMVTSSFVLRALNKTGMPVTARLTDEPHQRDRPLVLVPAENLDIVGAAAGIVVHGGVGEILLWLTGRTAVRIEFEGNPADVAAVRAGEAKPPGR
ncbi:MAG: TIGR03085 family metal-binding protein [Nakamurella sp.]